MCVVLKDSFQLWTAKCERHIHALSKDKNIMLKKLFAYKLRDQNHTKIE